MASTSPSVLDPLDRWALATRPVILGRPAAVLLGYGLVLAAGLLIPALTSTDALADGEAAVRFATGTGVVSIPVEGLSVLTFALLLPALLCLVYSVVAVVGANLLTGTVRLWRDAPARLTARTVREWAPALPARRTARDALLSEAAALRRTYAMFALGFLPHVAVALATNAVYLAFLFEAGACDGFVMTPAGHPLITDPSLPTAVLATHAAGLLATLWTGYIWVGALQRGRGLSRRAAAVVVVPIVAWIVYCSYLVGPSPV